MYEFWLLNLLLKIYNNWRHVYKKDMKIAQNVIGLILATQALMLLYEPN